MPVETKQRRLELDGGGLVYRVAGREPLVVLAHRSNRALGAESGARSFAPSGA